MAEGLAAGVRTVEEGVPLKLILLVDDSRFVRMATEKALSKAGYGVVTASDGEEALRIASLKFPT